MSEQEKPTSFMEELDRWTEATVIKPLREAHEYMRDYDDPARYHATVEAALKAIRTKVLESYRNGQKAQGSKPQNGFRPRRPFKASA